jgi:hypothetical protein
VATSRPETGARRPISNPGERKIGIQPKAMPNRHKLKPKTPTERRRKFDPDDAHVWIKAKIKIDTWNFIEKFSGSWGMGYGVDCLVEKFLQREAEVVMLSSMLAANLPKAKPDAMAVAKAVMNQGGAGI